MPFLVPNQQRQSTEDRHTYRQTLKYWFLLIILGSKPVWSSDVCMPMFVFLFIVLCHAVLFVDDSASVSQILHESQYCNHDFWLILMTVVAFAFFSQKSVFCLIVL